jgi:hypothetical protein
VLVIVLIAILAAALNLLATRADASAPPWSAGGAAPAHVQAVTAGR